MPVKVIVRGYHQEDNRRELVFFKECEGIEAMFTVIIDAWLAGADLVTIHRVTGVSNAREI